MATFRQRSGGWQVRVRRQGYPDVVKTFKLRQDGEKWARAIERELDMGCYVHRTEAERMTLAELLDRYGKEVSPQHKGHREELWKIGVILRDRIAKYSLVALTPMLLADYRDRRLQVVADATARHELNIISAAYKIATREWGIPVSNPVSQIKRPPAGRERKRRMSEAEIEAIIQHSKTQELPDFLRLAVATGMRRGEIIRLRWQDIDLGRRLAYLSGTKNGEDRIVPLSSEALAVLQAMPRRIDGRLFSLEPRGFSKAMRKSVIRARRAYETACVHDSIVPDPDFLCDLRLHDARHEAVSAFFERGLDVMEVASISGHKTLGCLKRYTHMRAERLALKLMR